MRILMINVVCGIRSTGRICTDLATALENRGHEVKIAYGREDVPVQYKKYSVRIGSDFDVKLHGLRARLSDGCGFGSRKATEKFIQWVKEYNPDVIHLHNIHGYYINIEILFDYLRTCGKKIIWTLHDCWAFTGHSAFCEYADCEKWKTGCGNCQKLNDYPASIIDRSEINWKKKRKMFTDIANLQLVTPSEWLSSLVRRSFLEYYPVKVINNGIDISVFKHLDNNELRLERNAEGKVVILGVSALWEKRKGLDDFIKLREMLDNRFLIILVGMNEKQIKALPPGIIGIERTNSTNKLAELYSLADYFVNPTYEDNYPTTNIEAMACGTTVITYDTGGSPEIVRKYGGIVVEKGNIERIKEIIDDNYHPLNNFNPDENSFSFMVNQYMNLYCTL